MTTPVVRSQPTPWAARILGLLIVVAAHCLALTGGAIAIAALSNFFPAGSPDLFPLWEKALQWLGLIQFSYLLPLGIRLAKRQQWLTIQGVGFGAILSVALSLGFAVISARD
jgi:hypothetical protein